MAFTFPLVDVASDTAVSFYREEMNVSKYGRDELRLVFPSKFKRERFKNALPLQDGGAVPFSCGKETRCLSPSENAPVYLSRSPLPAQPPNGM